MSSNQTQSLVDEQQLADLQDFIGDPQKDDLFITLNNAQGKKDTDLIYLVSHTKTGLEISHTKADPEVMLDYMLDYVNFKANAQDKTINPNQLTPIEKFSYVENKTIDALDKTPQDMLDETVDYIETDAKSRYIDTLEYQHTSGADEPYAVLDSKYFDTQQKAVVVFNDPNMNNPLMMAIPKDLFADRDANYLRTKVSLVDERNKISAQEEASYSHDFVSNSTQIKPLADLSVASVENGLANLELQNEMGKDFLKTPIIAKQAKTPSQPAKSFDEPEF